MNNNIGKLGIFILGMTGSFVGTLLANVIVNSKEDEVITAVKQSVKGVGDNIKDAASSVFKGARKRVN